MTSSVVKLTRIVVVVPWLGYTHTEFRWRKGPGEGAFLIHSQREKMVHAQLAEI